MREVSYQVGKVLTYITYPKEHSGVTFIDHKICIFFPLHVL